MRKQKRAKQKYDIDKISISRKPRKMTTVEALKIAIEKAKAFSKEIGEWIDNNNDIKDYLITLEVDEITTHLYCETDANEPFPMIMYKIPPNLEGVIRGTESEILEIKNNIDTSSIPNGLKLKIHTVMFLQRDRKDSFDNSIESYTVALKEERITG